MFSTCIFHFVGKDLIPELVVPYKKNVWFENRKKVQEATVTLHPDDVGRLPLNKSIIIDRGSGYQVYLYSFKH